MSATEVTRDARNPANCSDERAGMSLHGDHDDITAWLCA
jgi:hypothetical protein